MNLKLMKQPLIVFGLIAVAILLFPSLPEASAQLIKGDEAPIGVATGGFREVVMTVINYFLAFLGLLAVIMVIFGGVTYVISAGQDEKLQNAKNIIMYSLIGIVIVLLSFVIVNFVIDAV